MFYKRVNSGYKQALKGVELKTLVYGDKTLCTAGWRWGASCPDIVIPTSRRVTWSRVEFDFQSARRCLKSLRETVGVYPLMLSMVRKF